MDKATIITKAIQMRMAGASLYEIAIALGVTKEWLREYAGISDRTSVVLGRPHER